MILEEAIEHWEETDPVMAELAKDHPPERRQEDDPDPFKALIRAIVHQQLSLAAGRTIYDRVALLAGPTPTGVMNVGEVKLRNAGLSGAKVSYCMELAERIIDGLDLNDLNDFDDGEVIRRLTAIKGIGVWSAKMYLIFHLDRPDVLPWEDLGVRLAVQRFYGIPNLESPAWLKSEGQEAWTPYCSLATRTLWNARFPSN
jgi:DNA-3-methyladenine glycosylase II